MNQLAGNNAKVNGINLVWKLGQSQKLLFQGFKTACFEEVVAACGFLCWKEWIREGSKDSEGLKRRSNWFLEYWKKESQKMQIAGSSNWYEEDGAAQVHAFLQ
jgi:hypothetical protein